MRREPSEREVKIWTCPFERVWCVYSSHPAWTRKFRTMAKKHGLTVIELPDGIFVEIPLALLQITENKKSRRVAKAPHAQMVQRKNTKQASVTSPALQGGGGD